MMGGMRSMLAYGFSGRRHSRKPMRSAEEIQCELARHLAAVALHRETRRRIAEPWYRQRTGPFLA